jgi:hypothetical protein
MVRKVARQKSWSRDEKTSRLLFEKQWAHPTSSRWLFDGATLLNSGWETSCRPMLVSDQYAGLTGVEEHEAGAV